MMVNDDHVVSMQVFLKFEFEIWISNFTFSTHKMLTQFPMSGDTSSRISTQAPLVSVGAIVSSIGASILPPQVRSSTSYPFEIMGPDHGTEILGQERDARTIRDKVESRHQSMFRLYHTTRLLRTTPIAILADPT